MKKICTLFCSLILSCMLLTSCSADELLKVSADFILLQAGVCYSVPGMYTPDFKGETVSAEILEKDNYGRTLVLGVAENFITNKEEHVLVIFQRHEKSKVYYYEDINYIFCESSNIDTDELKQNNDWNQPLDFSKCNKREVRVSLDLYLVMDSIFDNSRFDYETFYESLQKNYQISRDEVKFRIKCDSNRTNCDLFLLVLNNDDKYFCIVDSSFNAFCTKIDNVYDFREALIDLKRNSNWYNQ